MGIVILVGNAARFVTTVIVIAAIINAHKKYCYLKPLQQIV